MRVVIKAGHTVSIDAPVQTLEIIKYLISTTMNV